MNNDTITLIANLALALSFVVGLVFGITQVRSAARDRRERLTLETIRNFQSREFAELIFFITNYKAFPPTWEQYQQIPAKEQIALIEFAQGMEHLGLLVADKFIDMDLIDKTLGSFVTTSWEKCKPMMLDARVKIQDPFLNEYFQWLAERIDKRMKEHPREPVYKTLKT